MGLALLVGAVALGIYYGGRREAEDMPKASNHPIGRSMHATTRAKADLVSFDPSSSPSQTQSGSPAGAVGTFSTASSGPVILPSPVEKKDTAAKLDQGKSAPSALVGWLHAPPPITEVDAHTATWSLVPQSSTWCSRPPRCLPSTRASRVRALYPTLCK